jgi:hypothetical protein
MIMKHCILCGQSKSSVRIAVNKKFSWPVLYCKRCKLGYINENDARIKRAYKQYYCNEFWHSEKGRKNIMGSGLKQKAFHAGIKTIRLLGVHPLVAITHHDMVKKWFLSGRFLEIGPGEGHSLKYFAKFYNVSAIEPDKINCLKINRRLGKRICMSGDVETCPIKGSFNIIYLSHVLEHLVYPLKFLEKIKSNMVSDAIIFVEVPNCENQAMMKISAEENETHTYHYTLESLRKLFKKAGFQILESGVYSEKTGSMAKALLSSLKKEPGYRKTQKGEGTKLVLIAKILVAKK